MLKKAWLNSPVFITHVNAVFNMADNVQNTLPQFPNVTKKDKKSCIKVGDPQLEFIKDIHGTCQIHPKVMPAWHDLPDFYARVATMNHLIAIQSRLMSMMEVIDNALFVAKHDAMSMSLDYYRGLKIAKESGFPGLEGHYVKARDHFKSSTGLTPEEQYPDNGGTESDTDTEDTDTEGKSAA